MKLLDQIKLALLAKRILKALPDIEVMKEKLASRKLWAAVAGAALVTFGNQLGLAPDMVTTIVNLVMVYIGGQAVVDAAAAVKK